MKLIYLNKICFISEDFLDISAAEAIAGFMIYGTAISMRDDRRHDNDMCRDLGLTNTSYRHVGESILGNNRIYLIQEGESNYFKYYPGPEFRWTNMLGFIGQQTFTGSLLPNHVFNLSEFVFNCFLSPIEFDKICDAIFHCIIISCLMLKSTPTALSHTFTDFQKTSRLVNLYSGKFIMSCKEFTNFFFTLNAGTGKGHYGILWLKNLVAHCIQDDENVNSFQEVFSRRLDNHLHMVGRCYLAFPVPAQQRVLIVLPFNKGFLSSNYLFHDCYMQAYKIKYLANQGVGDVLDGIKCIFNCTRKLNPNQVLNFTNLDAVFTKINSISQYRRVVSSDLEQLFNLSS